MDPWGIQRLVFVDTDPLKFEEEMDPDPASYIMHLEGVGPLISIFKTVWSCFQGEPQRKEPFDEAQQKKVAE